LQLTHGILGIPNFLLDYAEIIDGDSFAIADDSTENCRAIVAGWISGVRLIDNMAMASLGDSR
jgi:pantothenate synthetase